MKNLFEALSKDEETKQAVIFHLLPILWHLKRTKNGYYDKDKTQKIVLSGALKEARKDKEKQDELKGMSDVPYFDGGNMNIITNIIDGYYITKKKEKEKEKEKKSGGGRKTRKKSKKRKRTIKRRKRKKKHYKNKIKH